jgi:hypothetical protein
MNILTTSVSRMAGRRASAQRQKWENTKADAKSFHCTAGYVIASEAKQSPILRLEIASPASAGARFAALLAMTCM